MHIQYPPFFEMALSVTAAKAMNWKCNKFFLATEDKRYLPIFKQVFGNACVTIDRGYVDYNPMSGKSIPQHHLNRDNDYFLQGKEYLTQMAILAKCNSFVTAQTSGAVGVMVMSRGFENLYVFKLGRYNVVTPHEFMD